MAIATHALAITTTFTPYGEAIEAGVEAEGGQWEGAMHFMPR